MVVLILHLAAAALLFLVGISIYVARPRDPLNRALAVSLPLLGASTIALERFKASASPVEGIPYLRMIYWFDLPALLLLVVALDLLFLERPRPRWRVALHGALAAGVLGMLAGLALDPALYDGPGTDGSTLLHGPLSFAYDALLYSTWVLGIVLAARAAAAPGRSAIERRQAALVGLAFHVIFANAIAGSLRTALHDPASMAARAPHFALGVVLLPLAGRRFMDAFEGRARTAVALLLVLPAAMGILDSYHLPAAALAWALGSDASFPGSRPLWLMTFAGAIAVAVLRYGLAGFGPGARERLAPGAGWAAVLVLMGAVAVGSLARWGPTPTGFAVAALGLLLPAAIPWTPLSRWPRRVAERVLLDPNDPDLLRERVRRYRGALSDAMGPRGEIDSRHGAALAALRDELALSEWDHAVLLSSLQPEGAPRTRPTILLGKYAVVRTLFEGPNSTVYLARDAATGRDVVVKRLAGLGRRAEAHRAEVEALGRVSHPRVVRLFETKRVDGDVYLVLEACAGGTLAQRLRERGPMPPEQAVATTKGVLEALEVVHAAGLVHGDVKPENLLFTADGSLKLADFGSARASPRETDDTSPLAPFSGSLSTMAPEQVLGEPATAASDLYAVGAVLFRALTGESYLDLDGRPELEARGRILHGAVRIPHPRVPASLAPILEKALEKDPERRYRAASSMLDALDRASGAIPEVKSP